MTGMDKGSSSADRTWVKEVKAEMMADSGAWKAGERAGIIAGVRTRTDGVCVEPLECRYEGLAGTEVNSGRKV